jgi:hypothetical protein
LRLVIAHRLHHPVVRVSEGPGEDFAFRSIGVTAKTNHRHPNRILRPKH